MQQDEMGLPKPRPLGLRGLRWKLLAGLVGPCLIVCVVVPAAGVPLVMLGTLIALVVPAQVSGCLARLALPADLDGRVLEQGPAGLGLWGLIPDGIALLTSDALIWLPLDGNPARRQQIRLAGASLQRLRLPGLPGLRVLRLDNAESSLVVIVGERERWASRIEILQAEVGVVPWIETVSATELKTDAETSPSLAAPGATECRACATHLPPQARFCWQCGAAQGEFVSSAQPAAAMPSEQPVADGPPVAAPVVAAEAEAAPRQKAPPEPEAPRGDMGRRAPEADRVPQAAAISEPPSGEAPARSEGAVPGSALARKDPVPVAAQEATTPGATDAAADSLVDRAAVRLATLEAEASRLSAETLERIRKTVELTAWIDTDLEQVERILRAPPAGGPAPPPLEVKGKGGKRRKAKA